MGRLDRPSRSSKRTAAPPAPSPTAGDDAPSLPPIHGQRARSRGGTARAVVVQAPNDEVPGIVHADGGERAVRAGGVAPGAPDLLW
jgi:hypothetical protein